jgi:hypothetical protein
VVFENGRKSNVTADDVVTHVTNFLRFNDSTILHTPLKARRTLLTRKMMMKTILPHLRRGNRLSVFLSMSLCPLALAVRLQVIQAF